MPLDTKIKASLVIFNRFDGLIVSAGHYDHPTRIVLWACAGLTDPGAPLTAAQATTTRSTRDVMWTSWSVRD